MQTTIHWYNGCRDNTKYNYLTHQYTCIALPCLEIHWIRIMQLWAEQWSYSSPEVRDIGIFFYQVNCIYVYQVHCLAGCNWSDIVAKTITRFSSKAVLDVDIKALLIHVHGYVCGVMALNGPIQWNIQFTMQVRLSYNFCQDLHSLHSCGVRGISLKVYWCNNKQ